MPEPLDDCREERGDETRAEKKAWRTPVLITRRLDETAGKPVFNASELDIVMWPAS